LISKEFGTESRQRTGPVGGETAGPWSDNVGNAIVTEEIISSLRAMAIRAYAPGKG
jgi:hypothetical protein